MGRQEDAHEYLIALLDAMHERSIAGIPKPPPDVEFTSFIYRIFGGRIRSQVKCTQCNYESNTYDPFLDLSLEINHASSVDKALKRFTAGEALDGANKYKCPKENRGVRAIKRMTVETAPSVLVIQLKRFEFSMSGRKISKQVEFDPVLDLSPYMSHRPATPAIYDLYGVLVHQGHSMHSGHYFCFVKGGANGDWHKFDDTRVNLTAERNVLGQSAYILFYIKRTPPMVAGPMPRPLQPTAPSNGVSPQQQQQKKKDQEDSKKAAAVSAKRKRELEQQQVLEERKAALASKQEKQLEQQEAKRQKKGKANAVNRSHLENDSDDSASDSDNETATPPPPRKGRGGKQGAVENDYPTRQQQR
jgi:ubiquitin carboxyl-terminal hydrolase 36/42